MGEIYVKKNAAFQKVVTDGNTIIIGGGSGGGSGIVIASHAFRSDADGDATIPYASSSFPHNGTSGIWAYRNLSKYLDRVVINSNSLENGQPFNSESGVFTAKVRGIYQFNATAVVQLSQPAAPADGVYFQMWLRKDAVNPDSISNTNNGRVGQLISVYRDEDQAGSGTSQTVNATETWQVELDANDTIVLCGGWNSASGTTVTGASFSATYLGGATATPSGPVAMHYRHYGMANSGNNWSQTNSCYIPLTNTNPIRIKNGVMSGSCSPSGGAITNVFDTLITFSPTAGVFTAPVSGTYSIAIEGSIYDGDTDAGQKTYVWIQKTASGTTPSASNKSNAYGNISVLASLSSAIWPFSSNWLVQLDAGDTITWNVEGSVGNSGTGSPNSYLVNFSLMANLLSVTQIIDRESLAEENGWSELPGGLLMQWGRTPRSSFSSAVGMASVVFPRTFSEIPYNITTSWGLAGTTYTDHNISIHYFDSTPVGMKLQINALQESGSAGQNVTVNWLAIGKA